MNGHHAGIGLLIAALALLGAPGDAAAGSAGFDWVEAEPGPHPAVQSSEWQPGDPAPFTLSGTMDVTFVPSADDWELARAVVRCWICAGGSCDESSGFGPAAFVADLASASPHSAEERRLQVPFEVQFVPAVVMESSGAQSTSYTSYYCNLALAGRRSSGEPLMEDGEPLVVPRPYYPQGSPFRTANGAPLVVELSGIFP